MEKSSKRFEDWEEVDCNECTHYWDSSCDGASRGSRIGCNSFLATRSVVIPERLNALENRLKWLGVAIITLATINLILWTVCING
jgi:hypothetical protein